MRIAIDLTSLMPTPTGVDISMVELVRHLARIDTDNRYTLLVNTADRDRFDGLLGANMTVRACCVRFKAARLLFQQGVLPLASALGRFDVVHSPSFLLPLWRGRARHLLTVHDMSFFSMPSVHNRLHGSSAFRRGVEMSIRRAHLLNVPSEATRRDLLHYIPGIPAERVRVTPWGVHPRFCPAPQGETARHVARLGLPQRYLLYVGTIEPRKNLLAVLESFRRLIADGDREMHLVIAGAFGWGGREIFQQASSPELPELRGRVHFPGYVADDDLPWVYRGASLFVYPSLYEGFGFPPLEAMACGVPVIASLGSSIEENLRGAAELVTPTDMDALAGAVGRLVGDGARREQMVRAGMERASAFRWEETARGVLGCYREVAGAGT
jgi:glycosyltransferase involved in cell wall biosynthesis